MKIITSFKKAILDTSGISLLETMLALGIMAIVLVPLSMQLPGLLKAVNNIYINNRLVFIGEAIGEHRSRWANKRETDLDAFWVENWGSSTEWHDFKAEKIQELIGTNVSIPANYRVNIDSFDTSYDNKMGFIITVYYDKDGSTSLTAGDVNRLTFYTLVAERG